MPKNPKLRDFVEDVDQKRRKMIKDHPDKIVLNKENAIAARDFIEQELSARSRGGSRRWDGKPLSTDPAAIAARKRMRKRRGQPIDD